MRAILAYLDLGAGSMLLQMIIAGILGLGFTIKVYWRRLVAWLKREKPDQPRGDATPAAPHEPR